MKKINLILMIFILQNAFSQEQKILKEIVFYSPKFEIQKTGKSITKITQKELESHSGESILEILNKISGVNITGNNSSFGTIKSYSLRGSNSGKTLIIIDGFTASDPSGINSFFDLNLLPLSQIKSIEIIKGASSSMFGSDASAGVINITLKDDISNKINGDLSISKASKNTHYQSFAINGSLKKLGYRLMINNFETSGFESVNYDKKSLNYKKDKARKKSGIIRLNYKINDNLKIKSFASISENIYDYNGGGIFDYKQKQGDITNIKFGIKTNLSSEKHTSKLKISLNKFERKYQYFDNFTKQYITESEFDSKALETEISNEYHPNKNSKILFGINFKNHKMSQKNAFSSLAEKSINTTDLFVSSRFDFGKLSTHIGGRINNHSNYGNNFTFSINPSYLMSFNNHKLVFKTSLSTAFISPSLFQLYSSFGNKNLNPEKTKTFEIGASIYNKNTLFNADFFLREESQKIEFVTSKYHNLESKNKVKGVEVTFEKTLSQNIKFSSNYTYLNGENLIRSPKSKLNIGLDYNTKNTKLNINYKFVSDRNDVFYDNKFNKKTVVLKSYNLFGISIFHKMKKLNLDMKLSLNNTFNHNFEEIYKHKTIGRNFNFSVNHRF